MNTKKYLSSIAILGTVTSLAVAIPAFAAETKNQDKNFPQGQMREQGRPNQQDLRPEMRSAVFGTVTSISGNTLTVTSMSRPGFRASSTPNTAVTNKTYTVDATNAIVMKNNATGSVSTIVVGDNILIQGTITGTNVVATKINDGAMRGKQGVSGQTNQNIEQNPQAVLGNGEPIIAGTISTISGNTITITNKSNTTYTIDATSAKITQGQNISATISNLAVGDSILAQGTINGSSVTATTIIDQTNKNPNGANKGFLGGIGQFFMHMFGF
ncbi:MAG: hypothetical protein WCF92_00735 [bacterium]